MINKRTLTFLEDLRKHNTREWFTEYKKEYENARMEFSKLIDVSADELNLTDVIESKKIFRINRDVRFSKDKSPYRISSVAFLPEPQEHVEEDIFSA